MASSKSRNRLRLASEILRLGIPVETPCDRCFLSGNTCIAMEGRLKCAECVRMGKPCVNLSWASLDRTREEYQKKVDEDEEELAKIMSRLLRNKKILRQAEERARKKAICLENEMDLSGELEDAPAPDCPGADAGVVLSPAMWSLSNFIDESLAGLSEAPAVSNG